MKERENAYVNTYYFNIPHSLASCQLGNFVQIYSFPTVYVSTSLIRLWLR